MNPEPNVIGKTGLQFFGTMTASISHEIKNVLAIINENAGLMKDLALLAEQGRPLNLEKVKTLADRFGQQVTRADNIVKNLNQFSHSIDDMNKEVDMGEALTLVLSLANRFISMKNIAVHFDMPPVACCINTHPFFLNNLLWFCLEYAIDCAGKDKKVTILCQSDETVVSILFEGLENLSADRSKKSLFSIEGESLIRYLGAAVHNDTNNNSFVVSFPHHFESWTESKGETR